MKKLLFIATIVALFLGVLSFASCKADHDQFTQQGTYLNYQFSVGDQVNVNRYEIEVSLTGNSNDLSGWTTAGTLLATQEGLAHTYTLQVDATRWFQQSKNGIIYSRIKSVDNDGKFMYSKIQTNIYQ